MTSSNAIADCEVRSVHEVKNVGKLDRNGTLERHGIYELGVQFRTSHFEIERRLVSFNHRSPTSNSNSSEIHRKKRYVIVMKTY